MSEISTENVAPAADQISRSSRRKPPPDPTAQARRNLQIFKMVEIEKRAHREVADLFHLRRSRVTQIVQKIRMDLARASADDPQIENHLAQQRYQRSMEKLRLEYALDAAAEALRRDTPKVVLGTHRVGTRQKHNGERETWSETVHRDKPANVQLIKTFLRVSRDLGQLNEREIANNPVGEKLSNYDLFKAIASVLGEWSSRAPSQKDAPSEAFLAMVEEFEGNLRSWMYWYSMGVTPTEAWPYTPHHERDSDGTESDDGADHANQPAVETNLALTTEDDDSVGAMSDAYRS